MCARHYGVNIWAGNDDIETNGRRFHETSSDIADNMRSLIKSQEEQHQLNAAMLQSLTDIQWQMSSGRRLTNTEGSKSSTRRRKRYPSESSEFKGSTEDSSSSSHGEKRRIRYRNSSWDEFKKARPPTFNGETKNGQEAKAWLLGMRKYFQVQDYSGNMKARVSIFNLTGRASIWWEH